MKLARNAATFLLDPDEEVDNYSVSNIQKLKVLGWVRSLHLTTGHKLEELFSCNENDVLWHSRDFKGEDNVCRSGVFLSELLASVLRESKEMIKEVRFIS